MRLLTALTLLMLAAGDASRAATPPASAPRRVPVTTQAVAVITSEATVPVPGTVHASTRAVVAARVSGSVAAVTAQLGAKVATGDVLARLNTPEITAQLARARALLDQAEREASRDAELLTQGAATQDAVKASTERQRAAQAALAEVEATLAHAVIRAPFPGRVVVRHVEAGATVMPGQPLLTLDSSGDAEVEVGVPTRLAAGVKVGTALTISTDAGASLQAVVTEFAAAADPSTRTITARLRLPPGAPVMGGELVRVHLPATTAPRLVVPAAALSSFGQMERVFVVADGRAQLRLVRTGARRGGTLEILAGVREGEHVVAPVPATLQDGEPVEAVAMPLREGRTQEGVK